MKAYMKWMLFAVLVVFSVSCDDDDEVTTKAGNVKVSFGAPEMRVYENVSPQRIAIVLSQVAEQDVEVTVAVKSEDGAKEGVDYKLLNPEVKIAKGATGGYVEVEIQDYFDVKSDRQIVLEIVDVQGAVMAEDLMTCSILIVSNEGLPLIAFEEALSCIKIKTFSRLLWLNRNVGQLCRLEKIIERKILRSFFLYFFLIIRR